jgi:hypothetical protein
LLAARPAIAATQPPQTGQQVATVNTKTLLAKIVGGPRCFKLLQALYQGIAIAGQLAQNQTKAIAPVHTTAQFAEVPGLLQNSQAVIFQRRPLGLIPTGQANAEPLTGHRVSILEATVTDITFCHATKARQLSCYILGITATFFDEEAGVFALPGRRERQLLLHLEVFIPTAQ